VTAARRPCRFRSPILLRSLLAASSRRRPSRSAGSVRVIRAGSARRTWFGSGRSPAVCVPAVADRLPWRGADGRDRSPRIGVVAVGALMASLRGRQVLAGAGAVVVTREAGP
jgi:hypothetical protein